MNGVEKHQMRELDASKVSKRGKILVIVGLRAFSILQILKNSLVRQTLRLD